MYKDCPVCGQPTEIEVGFYYGTSYVSYVLSILISAFIVIIWFLVIGLSEIPLLVSWMVFNGNCINSSSAMVNEIVKKHLDILVCKI